MKEQWIKILTAKYAILILKSTIKSVLTHNLLKNWGAIWKKSLCTNDISYLHCSRMKNLTNNTRHENNNSVLSNLGIALRITCKDLHNGAEFKIRSRSTHSRLHLCQGLWKRRVVDLCLWWTDSHWQVWMWREIKESSPLRIKNRRQYELERAFSLK